MRTFVRPPTGCAQNVSYVIGRSGRPNRGCADAPARRSMYICFCRFSLFSCVGWFVVCVSIAWLLLYGWLVCCVCFAKLLYTRVHHLGEQLYILQKKKEKKKNTTWLRSKHSKSAGSPHTSTANALTVR